MADQEKKISMAEGVLLILSALFIDLIALVCWLTIILIPVGIVATLFYSFVIQFWMTMKGLKGLSKIVNAVTSFIPGKTIGVIAMIIMINNPKVSQIAGAAKGKAQGGAALTNQQKQQLEHKSLLADKHYRPDPNKAWNEI